MRPITVGIADPSHATRSACLNSLLRDQDVSVVARAASRFEVIDVAVALRPWVMVCGMSLAADFGHWLLRTLRSECPHTRVLLLTDTVLPQEEMMIALAMGPSGFVPRSLVLSHLPNAIRGITRGEAWLPRQILGTFFEQALR